jgi:alanine racemase
MIRLPRPTWFEIDLDAAADNLRAARRMIGAGRKLFAVVKAGGYGFGSAEMGRVFAETGADALAVADLGDGLRLRGLGLTLPILVYPNALPEAAPDVVAAGLIPTLTDAEGVRAYEEAAGPSEHAPPVEVFVKVDVGLERLGVPADQAVKFVLDLRQRPRLRLAGVSAHLHVPAGADRAYVDWQFGRFTAVLDALAAHGVDVPIRLAASSPLVLGHPQTYLNAADPGRMLYGIDPEDRQPGVPLRPVFAALKSRLCEVKELAPRERFAAEAPFPIPRPMRLGVIPIGAGDGFNHLHVGRVLVRGRSARILAGPSLEHTRIDLTAVPDARVGDEVVLIGRQGGEEITLDEVAAAHRLHPLHVALAVGPRVARVYLRGGRAVTVEGATVPERA